MGAEASTDRAAPWSVVGVAVPPKYQVYMKALAVLFLAVFSAAPWKIILGIVRLFWTALGVSIGVGFGLGLSLHVYEQLQHWKREEQRQQQQKNSNGALTDAEIRPKPTSFLRTQSNVLEDSSSYFAMMALAGYTVPDKVLRGQILKQDSDFFKVRYPFTDVPIPSQQGPRVLGEDWPSLPKPVTVALGRFVEHVMRDFIGGWYSKVDKGCLFLDEREKRAAGMPRDGKNYSTSSSEPDGKETKTTKASSIASRKMVFATLTHRNIPFLEQLYRVLSSAFGSLATRAEHINVFSLALLKWSQVLSRNLKLYRHMRRVAQTKTEKPNPRECEVIREYLLAGKLHKAVTFGLDVPSLLFADADGAEYSTPIQNSTEAGTPRDAIKVLEERLFGTPDMLKECELDYNRCLAFRLVRALLPKHEANSTVLMALVTEIFGACVLQPLMNLWIPSFLNEIIVNATKESKTSAEITITTDATTPATDQEISTTVDEPPSSNGSAKGDLVSTSTNLYMDGAQRTDDDTVASAQTESTSPIHSSKSFGNDDGIEQGNYKVVGGLLSRLVADSISNLDAHISFDSYHVTTRSQNSSTTATNFDDTECQKSIIRFVLVVEAVLLHGRCAQRKRRVEPDHSPHLDVVEADFAQILMELTSDMKSFEKRLETQKAEEFEADSGIDFVPDSGEISTVRTLISTWLHTGSLPRAMDLLIKGIGTILRPFYSDEAFLAHGNNANDFKSQIAVFDGIDVTVETMMVLASPKIDLEQEAQLKTQHTALSNNFGTLGSSESPAPDFSSHNFFSSPQSIPRFLDFHKNEAFSASLRSERERRLRSWESQKSSDNLQDVHRRGASKSEIDLHRELHALAKTFYNGTNVVSIRDAARKDEGAVEKESPRISNGDKGKVSLITIEGVSNRRTIEVPDDDSSFLLRAQPRPLNPVSVHRDDWNHDLSYKCFLATYEEPVGQNRSSSGKQIRRVWIQYYPIDRTATVLLNNDTHTRKLDRRKGKIQERNLSLTSQSTAASTSFLSGAFLRERHLCQRPTKGASAQSFLSSSVTEADFVATPRTGKAIDFIYRMSLFEKPTVNLDGKAFTIQDSTARGHHRADASALEISDASLSAILYGIGKERGGTDPMRHIVEEGKDGYPLIFMKFNGNPGDESKTEIKPYRVSFVRAALMVTSARQEAQLQCLIECVKVGSAKSATKARTDAQLRPTLKILDSASDDASGGIRESALLRDLKLGVYHIDREQLRRNGLLNPRYPTEIQDLKVGVEEATLASAVPELFNSSIPPTTMLYKLKCTAIVSLVDVIDDEADASPYLCDGKVLAATYREEWIVYRSIKDFQIFHKQLKSQVATAEFTASAGSRLVGAATAAFVAAPERRNRKALIPSLAQASKTGAIAVTQRAIARRGELLGLYMDHLLAPGNILNRCTELLLFVGAIYPFPPEIDVTATPLRLAGDPLGCTAFSRSAISMERTFQPSFQRTKNAALKSSTAGDAQYDRSTSAGTNEEAGMIDAILNKVDAVPLADVRNRLVELIKSQFGFENASFFRSRLLSTLEAASFVAITKNSEFRKLLYKTHIEQLNPDAVGNLIEKVLDILWPDGCWLVPREPLTEEEEEDLREGSKKQLHAIFPEQIRVILGRELTKDGLDIVHEMLQNRLVVKSLFYELFDLVWIEVFPELRDAIGSSPAQSDNE